MTSWDNVIETEPDRFLEKIFKKDSTISDFGDFKNAFNSYMQDSHAPVTEQNIIDLFESKECKERMKDNVSPQEFEQLFGDGIVVDREAISNKRMVTIVRKKIFYKAYVTKKGKQIRTGFRGESKKWSGVELKFIRARKVKGITPSKVFASYNAHFKSNPRTFDSIKTKFYRL